MKNYPNVKHPTKTHIDLFSGIGGFALAARWAGLETVQFVEIDPFCQKVLKKHWPEVPIHNDVTTYTYGNRSQEPWAKQQTDRVRQYVQGQQFRPFLLTGGFPCQPFSCAGKRRGKEDDRFLWPEMLRVISEARPTWIIGENVAGFINMGLDDSISDLEREGYEVQAFVIPACAKNAPHRRDRVWIVGHNKSVASRGLSIGTITQDSGPCFSDCYAPDTIGRRAEPRHTDAREPFAVNGCGNCHVADPHRPHGDNAGHGAGQISQQQEAEIFRGDVASASTNGRRPRSFGNVDDNTNQSAQCDRREGEAIRRGYHTGQWSEHWFEVATRLCGVDDGLPKKLDRVNRLKALGNAIVPQIAYEIIKAIVEIDSNLSI